MYLFIILNFQKFYTCTQYIYNFPRTQNIFFLKLMYFLFIYPFAADSS